MLVAGRFFYRGREAVNRVMLKTGLSREAVVDRYGASGTFFYVESLAGAWGVVPTTWTDIDVEDRGDPS